MTYRSLKSLPVLVLFLPIFSFAEGEDFDAYLIQDAVCTLSVSDSRLGQSISAQDRIAPGSKFTVDFEKPIDISDRKGSSWKLDFKRDQWIEADQAKITKWGLVVKKSALNEVKLLIQLSNPTVAGKLKKSNKGWDRVLDNTYTLSASTEAASNTVSVETGAFTTILSAHLDCEMGKLPVRFDDY